jgi:hypothetical protein
VPLSEHEQRVLEQIERALYADDPKFAAAVRGIDPRARQRRRYAKSGIGVVVGLALLPVGIAVGHLPITFAGFLLALAAFLYGVAAWRHGAERPQPKVATAPKTGHGIRLAGRRMSKTTRGGARTPEPKRGLMQRFEDRWNRRRDGHGA